eukprot:1930566-Karenia_brevis.AAC.1
MFTQTVHFLIPPLHVLVSPQLLLGGPAGLPRHRPCMKMDLLSLVRIMMAWFAKLILEATLHRPPEQNYLA